MCAARGGFTNFVDRAGKILLGVGGATHLHEADRKLIRHDVSLASSVSARLRNKLDTSSFSKARTYHGVSTDGVGKARMMKKCA